MEIKISDLLTEAPQVLKLEKGKADFAIGCVCLPEDAAPKSITFASTAEAAKTAFSKGAGVVIADQKFLKDLDLTLKESQVLISTPSIQMAMAVVLPHLDQKVGRHATGISAKASIHPKAEVSPKASVGDFAVIGEGVIIREHTVIAPHVVIEKNAVVGDHTVLHSFVYLGALCEIGSHCEIHPHTTIGSDGYGYYQDKDHVSHKITQIGKVVVEDHVEIGGNVVIDRATMHETRIGAGTKIDNLVHIAHNCRIGKNCLITAGFMMAGSSEIGDNFMCGGNTIVSDHVRITHNVVIAGRSTVTNDITEPGSYGGYPLLPVTDSLKAIASIAKLPELRRQVSEIRKKLGIE